MSLQAMMAGMVGGGCDHEQPKKMTLAEATEAVAALNQRLKGFMPLRPRPGRFFRTLSGDVVFVGPRDAEGDYPVMSLDFSGKFWLNGAGEPVNLYAASILDLPRGLLAEDLGPTCPGVEK